MTQRTRPACVARPLSRRVVHARIVQRLLPAVFSGAARLLDLVVRGTASSGRRPRDRLRHRLGSEAPGRERDLPGDALARAVDRPVVGTAAPTPPPARRRTRPANPMGGHTRPQSMKARKVISLTKQVFRR